MTISIITATYNAEKTIESALKSVLSQSYTHIEHIIVDGNSTDHTLDIIKKYQSKIHRLISEPDKGIYDAINKGINAATGDIIGVLHADDIFDNSNIIETIAQTFSSQNIDACYGDLQYVSATDTGKIIRYWKSNDFKTSLLKTGWMPPHPTLFVKKEIFTQTGLYDLRYKISADYDFILRLFSNNNYNFKYIPAVITRMRVGGASNKSIKNIVLKSKEDIHALKQNKVGGAGTLLWKNLSKIPQFIKK